MRVRVVCLLSLLLLAPVAARADVKPHAMCSDGMVLQQKAKVHVWGTADKGEKVTVSFRGKDSSAEAGADGKWLVTLESGEAGGPLPMTIAGKNKLEYKNVLVGEVWVASGQSNMEMAVQSCNDSDKKTATGEPENPMLRMFTVQKNPQFMPVDDVKGTWVEAGPKTVGPFSAVGYFFGRDLQKALKVPVGIIHSSWGGTRAETWCSRPVLEGDTTYKAESENFTKAFEDYKKEPDKVKNPLQANSPSALYNGMIHPILNYTIKGAIWYQGESNAGKAFLYRSLFPMMIKNWRTDWKQGDFPFLFVQLAPWDQQKAKATLGVSDWAELREAQTMTLKVPHTGMAVITDLGDEIDIHPSPKQPVGERLALVARAGTYGEKIEYSGPMFKEMKVEGNKAVLSFDHATGMEARNLVLVPRGDNHKEWRIQEGTAKELMGFIVCGEDKVFHPAKAEIVGDTVVVTCPDVAKPVAVRYGWAKHPECNLFNKAGLPASPFRTDDFPGITVPKK